MASQFSKDGKYFAILSTDGKLKVWDTTTSKFEQEFTPDYHLTSPCTCLQFFQPVAFKSKNGSPRKKIKRRNSLEVTSPYIILGTTSGLLLVYSIAKGDLDFSINSETSQSINCLTWQEDSDLYSAADQSIFCWDLQKKTMYNKWKAGNEKISCILKVPESKLLLTASKNIKMWDLESKEVLKTFTGHSNEISILDYVNPGKSDGYFISGSKGDRLLSCWNLKDTSKNAVANFLMEDIAMHVTTVVDAEGCTRLAAVTRSGVCHIYQHTLNGKASKPLKPKTTVQVVTDSSAKEVAPIPIISSLFNDDYSLQIAHGSAIIVVFESVVLSTYEKVQCLIRKDPRTVTQVKEADVSKTKTPVTDSNVHYLTPHTNNAAAKRKGGSRMEVPMEKRLENLTLNKLDGSSAVPKANNVANLLLQGLHSNDKNILINVLTNKDETVIRNTVKRLPISVVIPLVQELTSFIRGKTLYCQIGALWLKIVLQVHAGLLLSNPELSEILGPALGSIESRLSLQMPLSRLRGRLDLLVSQVNVSKPTDEADEEEALLVFNDKASSDSEMDGIELGAHSESDNEWLEDESGDENDIEENGDVSS